ncbi:MAG: hypothetical protein RSF90_00330 [Pygmaiobacter sp.]
MDTLCDIACVSAQGAKNPASAKPAVSMDTRCDVACVLAQGAKNPASAKPRSFHGHSL